VTTNCNKKFRGTKVPRNLLERLETKVGLFKDTKTIFNPTSFKYIPMHVG